MLSTQCEGTVMLEKTWQLESEAAGRIEFTCSQEGESSKFWYLVSFLLFIQSRALAYGVGPSIARVVFPTSPNLI